MTRDETQSGAEDDLQPPSARRRRILVVDDDRDIREALTDVLEDRGFEVRSAANGLEALRLLRSAPPPSVILLDMMMPVLDGYGFLEAHSKDPALASIPVAIITAGNGLDTKRIGGNPPIVRKPIDVNELVKLLHELPSTGSP